MSKILTRQQIDFWHENGYLEPIRFAPEDEMAGYVARLEDFEREYPEHVPKLDVKAHLLFGWANELVQNPVLLDVMEDLLGPNLLLTGAAFRIKPPDGRTFAEWHQDSYVAAIKPFFCTATLALSEYSAENGCLRVIPGSQRWGTLPMSDTGDENSILSRPYRVTSDFDEAQAVDVLMRPGELTLQHDHTIHGSRPNRSKARRIGLLADFTTPDARKESRERESAILVRGVDDYGYWRTDETPEGELDEAALAAWERGAGAYVSNYYRGSDTAPKAYR